VIGKSKEMLEQVKTAVRISLEAVGSILIPFASAEYDEIFKESEKNIEAIKNDPVFREAYDETAKILGNSDVASLAFFANPSLVITNAFLQKAPELAVDAIDVVTGGTMTDKLKKIKDAASSVAKVGAVAAIGSNIQTSSYGRGNNFLFEDESPSGGKGKVKGKGQAATKQSPKKLASVLSSPEMIKAINDNPRVKKMRAEAKRIVDEETTGIIEKTQQLLSLKSVQQIEKLTGKKIQTGKELQQLGKKAKIPDQKLSQEQFASMKKMIKDYAIKKMLQKIKSLTNAKITDENYVLARYKETIKKIQSM
jgi:hypothetical protein